MPDITMCTGKDCPFRETCYRYIAKPDKHYQSYFCAPPYDKSTETCSEEWAKEWRQREPKKS